MKMRFLGAGSLLLLLFSCDPADENLHPLAEEKFPVCFSLGLDETVLPFTSSIPGPATKSIPDFSIPEPTPETGGTEPEGGGDGSGENTPPPDAPEIDQEVGDLCTQIEYIVYASDGLKECIKQRHFNRNDLNIDFGIVYDTLPAGNYRIVFIAHSSKTAVLTDRKLTFDALSDIFYASAQPTIGTGQTLSRDFTLARIVSQIEFVSTDPLPTGQQTFSIAVDRYPNTLDLESGQGIASAQPVSFTYTFTAGDVGKTGRRHAFFSLIPAGNGTLDLQLTATDGKGNPTRQRTLSGVRPLANRILRYTGRLYSFSDTDNTFNLNIDHNGKWDEPLEEELPD